MAIKIREEPKNELRKIPTAVNINIKPELPKQVKVSIHSTEVPKLPSEVRISVVKPTLLTGIGFGHFYSQNGILV